MNIIIISQDLKSDGKGEDRLLKLGHKISSRGHVVTALTSNGAVAMDLGRKKIGLYHENGLTMIAFNVPGSEGNSFFKRVFKDLKFARMTGKQLESLPRPDLMLVKAPPLTAVLPAMRLSKRLKIPYIVEIKELWPDALIAKNAVKFGPVIKALQKLEQQVYNQASGIVTLDDQKAALIKERLEERSKVRVIKEKSSLNEFLDDYEEVLKGYKLKLN